MNAVADHTFNPEVFANMQHQEANSTEVLLVPEGTDYIGVSDPVTAESFRTFEYKSGERAGQKGVFLDINFTINDESGQLKEYLNRVPKVKHTIGLDVEGGNLVFGRGRNVGLGRLREAFGQNQNGRPWSPSMLGGQVARLKVKHRTDKQTGRTFAEVTEVAKLTA